MPEYHDKSRQHRERIADRPQSGGNGRCTLSGKIEIGIETAEQSRNRKADAQADVERARISQVGTKNKRSAGNYNLEQPTDCIVMLWRPQHGKEHPGRTDCRRDTAP